MDRILVKKIKSRELAETLRNMAVGDQLLIREKEFRISSVYNACHRLRKDGYNYTCSAKKNIDGCIVTRLA